jgi:hypothetical protein
MQNRQLEKQERRMVVAGVLINTSTGYWEQEEQKEEEQILFISDLGVHLEVGSYRERS